MARATGKHQRVHASFVAVLRFSHRWLSFRFDSARNILW
eukprot:COSAG02_NODE_57592_length_280_cov_0.574586_1_plen_38_part_10